MQELWAEFILKTFMDPIEGLLRHVDICNASSQVSLIYMHALCCRKAMLRKVTVFNFRFFFNNFVVKGGYSGL